MISLISSQRFLVLPDVMRGSPDVTVSFGLQPARGDQFTLCPNGSSFVDGSPKASSWGFDGSLWLALLYGLFHGVWGISISGKADQALTAQQKQELSYLSEKKDSSSRSPFVYLMQSVEQKRWTRDQKYRFLKTVVDSPFKSLSRSCRVMHNRIRHIHYDWLGYEQETDLLLKLGERDVDDSYSVGFSFFLKILDQKGKDADSKRLLLNLVVEHTPHGITENCNKLFYFLDSREGRALAEPIVFLTQIVEKSKEHTFDFCRDLADLLRAMGALGWSFEEQRQFLFLALEKGHQFALVNPAEARNVVPALTRALRNMFGRVSLGIPGTLFWKISLEIMERAGKCSHVALSLFGSCLAKLTSDPRDFSKGFLKILLCLNKYNIFYVLKLLERFHPYPGVVIDRWFSFYLSLIQRWPRMAFNLLEGILQALSEGLLSRKLADEECQKVVRFIEVTHGFVPELYRLYLEKGEGFLDMMRNGVKGILKDDVILSEFKGWMEQYGAEAVVGLMRMASPTTGLTGVSVTEQVDLLKAAAAIPTTRFHIPSAWLGKCENFVISVGEWRPRLGVVMDSDGTISSMIERLRQGGNERVVEEKEVVQALEHYLKTGRSEEARHLVHQALYGVGVLDPFLRAQLEQIQTVDYVALSMLEQIFCDPEALPGILKKDLEALPEEVFLGDHFQPLQDNVEGLIFRLKQVWSQQLPFERKRTVLQSVLRNIHPADIQSKLISREDIPQDLREALQMLPPPKPAISREALLKEILAEPLAVIAREKDKFEYVQEGSVRAQVRAVKSPYYVLAGVSIGICSAFDIQLWKNSRYKLLALSVSDVIPDNMLEGTKQDPAIEMKQIVGYMDVLERVIQRQRSLILLGMNPMVEFLSRVSSSQLFESMIAKAIAFAKMGRFRGLYIPVPKNIHSNLTDFQKRIRRSGWKIIKIPPVSWNNLPEPMPFYEVYVVWEEN